MGPTLVAYLHGAGEGAAKTVEVTTTKAAAGMAGALWLVAEVAVGAAAAAVGTAATGSGLGLDLPAGGGEEWRTPGLKLCPPRVFTMPRLEKGRRWGSGGRGRGGGGV